MALRGSGPVIERSSDAATDRGSKLRALREELGLTHKEAAELAGVSRATLIHLESGRRPPYMPTVTKIAGAYGVPLEELVGEE